MDLELRLSYRHNIDAEFLAEFTLGRVFIALALLELPTGELPQPAVPLVRRALTDEELTPPRNDGGDDAGMK